jgi:hypothetical protein
MYLNNLKKYGMAFYANATLQNHLVLLIFNIRLWLSWPIAPPKPPTENIFVASEYIRYPEEDGFALLNDI